MSREQIPVILASRSPRRLALLQRLGFSVRVEGVSLPEIPVPSECPESYVLRMARQKVEAVAPRFPHHPVLGADTAVVLQGQIFGKPSGPAEAEEMLSALSGKVHQVLTGVAFEVLAEGDLQTAVVETLVKMRRLTGEEIRRYVATAEPLDKAGAYAIQGEGGMLIEAIYGSYTNVIGLPLPTIIPWLRRFYQEEDP
ncbi:MAG: septum formation protein Maf [Nitrospinota bacterium]|nr:MAG: septum formation protein Maf [Nitrospinota bacterium]